MSAAGKLKLFLPLGINLWLSEIRKCWHYKGCYTSWEAAEKNAAGYDTPHIAEKVLAATQEVVDGKAAYERDSVLFYKPEYNWHLLSALYYAALSHRELHVLDFGGALGSLYWQNRSMFKNISKLSWSIVEQQTFINAAKRLKYDAPLYFYDTIENARKEHPVNVALFATVLQYLGQPEFFLDKLDGIDFVIVDRHPEFADHDEDIYTVQHIGEPIYKASYPLKIWGRGKLEKLFTEKYEPVCKWDCELTANASLRHTHAGRLKINDIGMMFQLKK